MPSKEKKRSPFLISSLPEELVVEIIGRVPRCNYQTLSRVSKHFRSLVASPDIYARRSLLGRTEHCVYVVLYDRNTHMNRLFILHMNRLVLIPSLPVMPRGGSYVVRRSMIYVLDKTTSNGFSIDCRSHTVQPLPSLSMPMSHSFTKLIHEKIYLIRTYNPEHKVMVFDTKTQMWKPEMTESGTELCDNRFPGCIMYMRNSKNKFFRPNEIMNKCVVDHVQYKYNDKANKLKVYDPKHKCWTVVQGVKNLLHHRYYGTSFSQTVNMVGSWLCSCLFQADRVNYIWSVEIALQRRREGEILGKVERHSKMFGDIFSFVKLLTVIV